MNFFNGVLTDTDEGKSRASFGGDAIDISDVRLVSQQKSKGDAAHLGIRPQHLALDKKGSLAGKVTLVERLGTETVVDLVSDTQTQFRFATPDNVELAVDDQARFSFDAGNAHLF